MSPVVHMDDLYEGWAQALGDPLAARVEAWLLVGWEAGLSGMHPKYDWALGRYAEWVTVPVAPVVILEGCGSGSARDQVTGQPGRLGGGACRAPAPAGRGARRTSPVGPVAPVAGP